MFKRVNKKLRQDYFRNLGLASVIGSMSAFFLEPHGTHALISIGYLFIVGIVTSYFGVVGSEKIEEDN